MQTDSSIHASCSQASTTTEFHHVKEQILNAVKYGRVDFLSKLIDQYGCDLTAHDKGEPVPLLNLAIRFGESAIAEILLNRAHPINPTVLNAQDSMGYTSLMCAAQIGDASLMRRLVDLGANAADVNITTRNVTSRRVS